MIKQITIDNDNVVLQCSIGGILANGIDVEDIPDEVMSCPTAFKYVDGQYITNPDYVAPVQVPEITIDDLAIAIAELVDMILGVNE